MLEVFLQGAAGGVWCQVAGGPSVELASMGADICTMHLHPDGPLLLHHTTATWLAVQAGLEGTLPMRWPLCLYLGVAQVP